MKTLTITRKNLLYIPDEFQKQLGLTKPGKLMAKVEKGRLILEPVKPISELFGILSEQRDQKNWQDFRDHIILE